MYFQCICICMYLCRVFVSMYVSFVCMPSVYVWSHAMYTVATVLKDKEEIQLADVAMDVKKELNCSSGRNGRIVIIKKLHWNFCKLKVFLRLEWITWIMCISCRTFQYSNSYLELIKLSIDSPLYLYITLHKSYQLLVVRGVQNV